ncbi:tyrosine-type recombinase/integrase [Amycolatopsis acidicola]|uniref:Tyrosine-type recombinase/integrase n=1 Tax=Amycolatopsis acidicola TaxID=2596893 RepID=A0A5N0V2Z5_9PSEU|nr:tyrosine-type recombinase/integrase [Amycolatopsis acidicola]KAA9157931.1 tyrosine-type recombinase/integrase [Amycolatopsis acidicola]
MGRELTKQGLPRPRQEIWRSYVEEWDRALRAANHPETTRYNYELAVTQLGGFLGGDELRRVIEENGHRVREDDSDAAEDPTDVQRRHVEWFITWMLQTRSASTAVNKYKALQQFFRYLVDEGEMRAHPMDRMHQPSVTEKLVSVLDDQQVGALLDACSGKDFLARRDTALIRLLFDTGGRLAEVSRALTSELDMQRDLLIVHGKGDKYRAIPFGAKTGQALTRYLRVRGRHQAADLPHLFLAQRGRRTLTPNAIKIMLRRRGREAGIPGVHAHQFRHTLAHEWQLQGGNESDLMAIMGWASPEMLRRYGKSAAAQRAQHSHRTLALGDRI